MLPMGSVGMWGMTSSRQTGERDDYVSTRPGLRLKSTEAPITAYVGIEHARSGELFTAKWNPGGPWT